MWLVNGTDGTITSGPQPTISCMTERIFVAGGSVQFMVNELNNDEITLYGANVPDQCMGVCSNAP